MYPGLHCKQRTVWLQQLWRQLWASLLAAALQQQACALWPPPSSTPCTQKVPHATFKGVMKRRKGWGWGGRGGGGSGSIPAHLHDSAGSTFHQGLKSEWDIKGEKESLAASQLNSQNSRQHSKGFPGWSRVGRLGVWTGGHSCQHPTAYYSTDSTCTNRALDTQLQH